MTYLEEEYKNLNKAQRLAVDQTEGPVLIIAGPGTGKTQLLSLRVASILRKTDANPSNILCLTFTESGQQALQQRLAKFIGPASYEVTVSTYHSFGNDLLRRFPEYSDDALGQQPIDNLLLDEILRSVLESLPYSNTLRKADVYIEDLKTFISDAKRGLLSPDSIRQLAGENLEFIKKANLLVQENLTGLTAINKQAISLFSNLCQALNVYAKKRSVLQSVDHMAMLVCESLQTAVDEARTSGKTAPITAWKNRWLAKDKANQFVIDGARTNARLQDAADIYEAYNRALEARGVFDYDDMILRAIKILEENDDLRFTLQEQYQYIMLDEFQDTNAMQFKLIKLLTNNPVNEGKPNILAVGDDDQAIYAFQGASYSNMRQFLNMYKEVLTIPLAENYRSHRDILHVAKNISSQITDRLSVQDIEKKLIASNKKLPPRAVIERHELPSDIAELSWVTSEIEKLIKDGCDPRQIAVLAPKHRYLEPLVPFLNVRNIPLQYEKRENILDDKRIKELVKMAKLTLALAQNNQEGADALWPQVLSYDFWDIDTELIWKMSWATHYSRKSWHHTILENPAVCKIGLFFGKLAYSAAELTLERVLDSLIGTLSVELDNKKQIHYSSPFYEYYFGKKDRRSSLDFWQALTNLTVLRARLREYKADDDSALNIEDFIEFVTAHEKANIKIISTTPYREQTKAVQLMTVYKAKGLEFDTVFILGCQDEIWGSKSRSNNSALSLPANLQRIRYAGMNEDERIRLFFVAITRARHHLYLTSHRANYAGKVMTRLKYLQENDSDENTAISQVLPEAYRIIRRSEATVPDAASDLEHFWHVRHVRASQNTSLKSLLNDRLQRFTLTPSDVNTYLDVVYGGPESFFLQSILRFPSGPSIDSEYGDAMHRILEWLHIQQVKNGSLPSQKETLTYFKKLIAFKRLDTVSNNLLLSRGQRVLELYLRTRSDRFNAQDRHEVKQHVLLGDVRFSGKIDKLTIDNKNKNIEILDFKTGKSYAGWKNEPKLMSYKRQLYLYKLLLENSPEFKNYNIKQGVIEFIEPDDEGNVNTLSLEFNDEEAAKVRRIVEIVWHKIHEHDFPDISPYPPNAKGARAFEHDLFDGKI